MPCPHSMVGEAASCSQCLGAVPRIITRDEVSGQLAIDGQPVTRAFALAPPTPRNVKRWQKRKKVDPADDDAN